MKNRFYQAFDYEHIETRPTDSDDHRNPFQIDRDRVVFSPTFRRLQSKTQVFQSGEYDFYRTRLTHTIEVAHIARSITEYLNANSPLLDPDFRIDSDLVEAVGLAHDLGHPPFGHIGERKLNELMHEHGGFEGNAQTLRILAELIYQRGDQPVGMKSTRAFLDGVLKYKRLYGEATTGEGDAKRFPDNHFIYDHQKSIRAFVFSEAEFPLEGINQIKSIECQIMDWADDTAYSLHDIVDGIQARFITLDKIDAWRETQNDLSATQGRKIDELIESIRKSYYEPRIGRRVGKYIHACRIEKTETPLSKLTNRHSYRLLVDPEIAEECQLYKRIAVDLIFKSAPLQQIEYKGGHLLEGLFKAFAAHYIEPSKSRLRILPTAVDQRIIEEPDAANRYRIICDHLAAMTDSEALRIHRRLFDADFASIAELT